MSNADANTNLLTKTRTKSIALRNAAKRHGAYEKGKSKSRSGVLNASGRLGNATSRYKNTLEVEGYEEGQTLFGAGKSKSPTCSHFRGMRTARLYGLRL